MTGQAACKIIQTFPILLILAQKKDVCSDTPLIYFPPKKNSYSYGEGVQTLMSALGGYFGGGSKYPSYGYGYGDGYNTGHESGYNYYYPSYYSGGSQGYYNKKGHHKSYEANGKLLEGSGKDADVEFIDTGELNADCKTPDGIEGVCRNIRKCPPMLDIVLTVKSNPRAGDYLRQSLCRFEGNDPVVCCPTLNIPGLHEDNNVPTAKSSQLITEEEECGVSNSSTFRVVNGQPALLGQFPWMALLGYKSRRNPGTPRWLCGGTLLTHRHVITAAHCIHGHESDLYLIRLGELDLGREDDGATPTDYEIEKQIPHEKYNPSRFMNDIGILKLARYVTFSKLILPICLPTSAEFAARDLVRSKPFIAGWGDTEFRGPSSPSLQFTQIPIQSTSICHEVYKKINKQVDIDDKQICAGYLTGTMDACQGDSGGPLMLPEVNQATLKAHHYLAGVVSFGYRCAEPGYPGVYTRVTAFLPWILKALEQ